MQESIARGLGAHQAEKDCTAAESVAAKVDDDLRRQQIVQAKTELREILSDALVGLQAVEPNAVLQDSDGSFRPGVVLGQALPPGLVLSTADVRLRIQIWDGTTTNRPVQGDTMLLAGSVSISNRRHKDELNSANVVYEQADGRYAWQIYKFHSVAEHSNYQYGPYDRTHGLDKSQFLNFQERSCMIHPVMHAWTKTVALLTAEKVLELFQEAVGLDLRPSFRLTDFS